MLIEWVSNRNNQLGKLYGASEPALCLSAEKLMTENYDALSIKQSSDLLSLFASHTNGVIKYSDALPDIVESSNNLGVINLETGQALTLYNLCRSASNEERDAHAQRISHYQQQFGLTVEICGAYPGWQHDNESLLLKQALTLYQRLFAKRAVIQVIHAGLECGLLSDVYPDCDMISFGPTITGAHSPREQVNIKSVDKFWDYLAAFIADLAKA
ncbi:MAG: hypothetical protein KZQ64_14330 [gamma proteobacterium symbiont of Bathyaustriella thionipta]|nr:hypothetical protein [gamma proteobacterium symbiont of Bathyaustriella thionipta]MCU7951127.1 hypothetical protein [gamma proteobacterium symbiont of Bathyaustriella thionipta]MCU7954548.1 hypothetical protein [gamma proteobacterium symbiont of Bathyaustriella thionipta]MCU7957642.1 hypothetical protein [gamma proteobacterium symbiont of Bathyaustriella thionipta]MCU7966905.1 hypothetical protein [gamma proteobacterium symbiont of Bathyaustriella thionipta]